MPSLTATIEQGRIEPDGPEGVLTLARLNGKRVTVDVEIYRKGRSGNQNRYLHGVVLALLGEHCGYHKDEMRAALCHKFLSDVDEKTGLMRIKGTRDLDTAQFEEFLSRVRMWAGEELGVFIPLPNEYDINEARKQ